MSEITLKPIGYVRNSIKEPAEVIWEDIVSEVVLDQEWSEALEGLDDFSHIWVITWLHRIQDQERGTQPRIHPERRQDIPTVGLFATRTPRRPNPIAMTAVPLLERRGTILRVKGLDVLDGTPVLDVKPYLKRGDRISGAREPAWISRLRRRHR